MGIAGLIVTGYMINYQKQGLKSESYVAIQETIGGFKLTLAVDGRIGTTKNITHNTMDQRDVIQVQEITMSYQDIVHEVKS